MTWISDLFTGAYCAMNGGKPESGCAASFRGCVSGKVGVSITRSREGPKDSLAPSQLGKGGTNPYFGRTDHMTCRTSVPKACLSRLGVEGIGR